MDKLISFTDVLPHNGFLHTMTAMFKALGKRLVVIQMDQIGFNDLVMELPVRVVDEAGKISYKKNSFMSPALEAADVFILSSCNRAAQDAFYEAERLWLARRDAVFVTVYFRD